MNFGFAKRPAELAMMLVAGASLAALAYNVGSVLSGSDAADPFKNTTILCDELQAEALGLPDLLKNQTGATEYWSATPHPDRDRSFIAIRDLGDDKKQGTQVGSRFIIQRTPPEPMGKGSWDGILDADGGWNHGQWPFSVRVGSGGTGWWPRILKGSTIVQECRPGGNGITGGSLLAVGIVAYAPDPVLEALVLVSIFLFAVTVVVAVRIARARLTEDLRHDLGYMLAAIDSSFPSLQQPNFSGEEIKARLASFGETLKNFKLAVDSGREYVSEPSLVALSPLLTHLLTPVFMDDESEEPDRLVISTDSDGISRSVPVAVDCLPADLEIVCWKDPLDRVLVNLLVNAARAARAAGDDGRVHVKVRESSGNVRIVVRNNGEEFPAAVLKSFRRPFHLRAGPTGMGLTVVLRVVRKHGGTARIGNRMNPETGNREAEVEIVLPKVARRNRFRKFRGILRRGIRGRPKDENSATG